MTKWIEDQWINQLKDMFSSHPSIVGIGDDCAVIPKDEENGWLVTTDALVEGIHFLKEQISASDLGYKTIAVNVSDIAAMGGRPNYAFLSVAIPKTLDCQWGTEFITGLQHACNEWNIALLGGDTVGSKRDLFINLTLIGTAPLTHIKYRNRAQPNDLICVTGCLGDSGAGLKALQENIDQKGEAGELIHSHFHPEPHVQQGAWLASHSNVHAMMDLSDGLDCDLRRMLRSSACGAVIEICKIPLSQALIETCSHYHWDPMQLALMGGEDYCLLITLLPDDFPIIQSTFQKKFGSSLYEIGQITSQSDQLHYRKEGKCVELNYNSFDHFQ